MSFWGSKQGFPGLSLRSAALVLLGLKAISGSVHPGCRHPGLSTETSKSKAMLYEDTIPCEGGKNTPNPVLRSPSTWHVPSQGRCSRTHMCTHQHSPKTIRAVRYEGGWGKKERITSTAIFSSRWVFPFQKLYLYSPAPPPFPVLITPILESTIPLEDGGREDILTSLESVCS